MADLPPLPPGFTLDASSDVPPLPPGFVLDQPQGAPEQAQPSGPLDFVRRALQNVEIVRRDVGQGMRQFGQNMGASLVGGAAGLGGIVSDVASKAFPEGSAPQRALHNDPAAVSQWVTEQLSYHPESVTGQVLDVPARVIGSAGEVLRKGVDYTGVGYPYTGEVAAQVPAAALAYFGLRGRPATPHAQTVQTEATVRAQNYVRGRTRLDWNNLSDSIRAQLTEVAKDAKTLDGLDPLAVERQALLQSLPAKVPATYGQLTRSAPMLRNEGNVSATAAGAPIRDVHMAQNQALLENLDILKGKVTGTGKTAATAATPEQVGTSIQDMALRAKLAAKQAEVRSLYKAAEQSGEMQGTVSPKPILEVIEKSPDLTHLGWVQTWLKKMKATTSESTDGIEVSTTKQLSLKELEDLRQAAVAKAMDGGTEGYYAGKVISAIDQATEGAGGTAYKAARAARKQQALEFEDQGAVAKLVENRSRTDRAVALENTVKSIRSGSLEDIEAVKRSLLTGPDPMIRMAGRKAWRDLRAQVIQDIKDTATRNIQMDEKGSANLTPAALKRGIDSYGEAKLDSIFGPGVTKQLNRILEAAKIVKTEPPVQVRGSSTVANALTLLERNIGKIPLVGPTAAGAVKGVGMLRELGTNSREAAAAIQTPIERAVITARPPRVRNALRTGVAVNALAVQQQERR